MCGVVGLFSSEPVNQAIFDALTVLQHRGQDAAGIMTQEDDGTLTLCKGNGLVREVFKTDDMKRLTGTVGIGHVRYPTAGTDSQAEAQPMYVNSPYGISLVHNGNLINAEQVREALFKTDRRHLNTNSDSEVILNVLAHELQKVKSLSPTPEQILAVVEDVYARCEGAYAVIALITGVGLLAFRDPHGIRPLVMGEREEPNGQMGYMIASESVALGTGHYKLLGDIKAGEAVFIDLNGKVHRKLSSRSSPAPCIFEYVYLARPDSIIEGVSVYKTRLNAGEYLAKSIKDTFDVSKIDVVIPIPETSRSSAMSVAKHLGIEFREGYVKNRYIGRTFIMPGQKVRKKSVRQKLNAIDMEFEGKNVLLVDDSIVRGTTSKEIIQMARESGAKNVYFASVSPPIRFPNIYGIDMPVNSELIAYDQEVEDVRKAIEADALFYLSLDDLKRAVLDEKPNASEFDTAIFDGRYITGDPETYLAYAAKRKAEVNSQPKSENSIDMHNSRKQN
ncbi:MAG: amidophosphoribosyltransferase [Legionellales bacterium]|nr:amidophosphoribosyltransferase [Legionellales bacterium]